MSAGKHLLLFEYVSHYEMKSFGHVFDTNLTNCILILSFYSGLSTYQQPDTVGPLPNGKNSTLNQSDPLLPMSEPTQSYDERECSCPREYYQRAELNTSLFFADCKRSIDFVLAYRTNPNEATEAENEEKRRIFQENLIQQGLEVELSQKDQIYFVKVGCQMQTITVYVVYLIYVYRNISDPCTTGGAASLCGDT